MGHEECSLWSPVFPLCSWDSSFPFLEESSWEVPRSARELCLVKTFLNRVIVIEDHNRCPADKQGEHVPILPGELGQGLAEVPHVHIEQVAHQGHIDGARGELFRSDKTAYYLLKLLHDCSKITKVINKIQYFPKFKSVTSMMISEEI